jgi:methionyl aminopeptidase
VAIPIKSPHEIEQMARAGAALDRVLGAVAAHVRAGVTTGQLGDAVEDALSQIGGESLLKGYTTRPNGAPFPSCASVSVNEQVSHAVPGGRVLRPGDTVTLDVAMRMEGWCVDAARTVVVAGGDMRGLNLANAAREALRVAISSIRPGVRWSTIAAEVERNVAGRGCHLVAGYCGHGIGRQMHEPPRVCFARGDFTKTSDDFVLWPGMVLCVEPIVGEGEMPFMTAVSGDGWTVVSNDSRWSAHEEACVAVTRGGCRMLAGRATP